MIDFILISIIFVLGTVMCEKFDNGTRSGFIKALLFAILITVIICKFLLSNPNLLKV